MCVTYPHVRNLSASADHTVTAPISNGPTTHGYTTMRDATEGRAGRTISRMEHSDVARLKPMTPLQPLMQASVKPPSPLLAPEQQPLKPVTPLLPKNTPKTPISHPQRRWWFQSRLGRHPQRRQGFQTSGPPGRQGQAAMPTGSNDTTASQISHVIYRAHFSRHPKNVAIPTMQIQCLNKSQGNYVRN